MLLHEIQVTCKKNPRHLMTAQAERPTQLQATSGPLQGPAPTETSIPSRQLLESFHVAETLNQTALTTVRSKCCFQ